MPTLHTTSLEIDGHIITSHVATAIKEASYHNEFIEYITQRAG
jgi:DNA-dependent RNA polymerase auxiliary subunit epsilon